MKNRRKVSVLLAAMIAASFAFAAFAQSAAAGVAATPLRTLLSGKCLEVAPDPNTGVYTPNGAVYAENCRTVGQGPQLWWRSDAGTAPVAGRQGTWSVFSIHNAGNNGCLGNGGQGSIGAAVSTFGCSTTTRSSRLWAFGRTGPSGYRELVNAASGMCLDVYGGFLGAGVRMSQYPCQATTPFAGNLFLVF